MREMTSTSPTRSKADPTTTVIIDEMAAEGIDDKGEGTKKPIFRDIRRYYCEYCGICRSKKSLIRSHVLTHHKDEVEKEKADKSDSEMEVGKKEYICEECGESFRKPAYLQQHMRGHSFERPFACPLEDCHFNYRRKDHLNRHLLKHQGKLFECPTENCNKKFAFQGNMTRHVREMHDDESSSVCEEAKNQYVCSEVGCGKTFKYASKLRKHEDSHVKLDYVDVICGIPGCLQKFSNSDCLRAHMQSCHQYVVCETCGVQQLKKNLKRHLRTHEGCGTSERIKCSFQGCQCTFSNRSNLNKHVKAVHQELRPFSCRISGCHEKFPYKHVRDNHEKSGAHVHTLGDFVEADERWCSRPRGGRKRKGFSVEMITRKRVAPLSQESALDDGTNYLRWLLSD